MKNKIKKAEANEDAYLIQKSPEELFKILNSSEKGLSEEKVLEKEKKYGRNEIFKKKHLNPILKFLSYFTDPLIIILLIASVISGITSEIKNMIVIMSMVFMSVILNFYQEHKSSKAAEKIEKRLAIFADVVRSGKKIQIPTKNIVPGDVVLLSAGDIVPADGVIFEQDDFFVNEASLTGESFPMQKCAYSKGTKIGLGAEVRAGSESRAVGRGEGKESIVFSGTNVVSGFCRYIVTDTGASTEFGKIAGMLEAPEDQNAFEKGIKDFGVLIIKVILFICVIIFLINAFYKKDVIDSLIFAIAVAVGVTPELLPMIMSVTMSKGSIDMSKKGVLVKRLSVIPDFGSMDVLCTDKTGTLTQDKITLVRYTDVYGKESKEVLRFAYVNGSLETGIKSLLDKAILEFKDVDVKGLKKINEIPYDFERKRSTIVYLEKKGGVSDGGVLASGGDVKMVSKGAPEEVFKICTSYFNGKKGVKMTPVHLKDFKKIYDDFGKDGFRVLAIAMKDLGSGGGGKSGAGKSSAGLKKNYAVSDEHDMTLCGFLAFYDPPKASVKDTLLFMKEHGIEVKILTGDSALVTEKVCKDLGIEITGIFNAEEHDMDKMSDAAIALKALKCNIFARLSPHHKEKIISVLRSRGKVVGYLGDGINDAPSLKIADVGISVDNAVDVAKETADIILLKKGLEELMEGVLEGRKTFGNTMKYLMMGLSSNFGNMFSMIGASLFLPFFPMLPTQILLNNLIYDASQLAIPLDKVDEEYLKKPKHWDMKFIKHYMVIFGPVSSLFDFITFYVLYKVFAMSGSEFQTGWFIESLATQVFVIYIIRTRLIPFIQSRPSLALLISTLGAVFIGWLLTLSWTASFFNFVTLDSRVIGAIALIVLGYLVVVMGVKSWFYRRMYKEI